jgi:hypothetical protein
VRFLIDECLHESLVGVEATRVNHLGLSGKPDRELAGRIAKDEFTFVTNNRIDFIPLFEKIELHSGLVIIVPNAVPVVQQALYSGCTSIREAKRSRQLCNRGEIESRYRTLRSVRPAGSMRPRSETS